MSTKDKGWASMPAHAHVVEDMIVCAEEIGSHAYGQERLLTGTETAASASRGVACAASCGWRGTRAPGPSRGALQPYSELGRQCAFALHLRMHTTCMHLLRQGC